MSAEQTSRGRRFDLLYRISQIFSSTLEMDEVLNRVMDEVIESTGAERAFIVSLDDQDELIFHVARGVEHQNLAEDLSQVSGGIIREVINTGKPVLTYEATSDSRFSARASVLDLGLKSILCVPLKGKFNLSGVIYVENRIQKGIFEEKDLELLTAIATNASVALENVQLFKDLQNQIRTLNMLYEISSDLTSQLDLNPLLRSTLERIQTELESPAASLFTIQDDQLFLQVSLGEFGGRDLPSQKPLDKGIAGWVICNTTGTIVNDVEGDPRFNQEQAGEGGFKPRNLVAVPLLVKEKAIGVIELYNKHKGFTAEDLALLTAIASSASIAIDNARLYQSAVEKGRMERELQMALNVQKGLLPPDLPSLHGWEFAARWQPARQVSGDFYDFIPLSQDSTHPSESIGLVIADVTDKGMPAALFMAHTRSILRSTLHQAESPEEAITRTNHLVCMESNHGLFVTLFYAELNPSTGGLNYVNAGHNPPLLYRAANNELVRLMPTGIPLGVVEEFQYKAERIIINHGDFLFCYTDGITEPINSSGVEFGLERLEGIIQSNRYDRPDHLAGLVDQAVDSFTGTKERFDDKTIVIAKRSYRKMASGS